MQRNIIKTQQERQEQLKVEQEQDLEAHMFEFQPRNIRTSQQGTRGEPDLDQTTNSFPRTKNDESSNPANIDLNTLQQLDKGRFAEYRNEEEDIICARFPHLKFCMCQMTKHLNEYIPEEIVEGVFIGSFYCTLNTKKLLELGITHILNVSSQEYTKRSHYFTYMSIDVYNNQDEDIKKHFRRTNRFITEGLECEGKILIHGWDGISTSASFALAFMIKDKKIPLKLGLRMVKRCFPDLQMNEYFKKQLEQYDLEKLAHAESSQNS